MKSVVVWKHLKISCLQIRFNNYFKNTMSLNSCHGKKTKDFLLNLKFYETLKGISNTLQNWESVLLRVDEKLMGQLNPPPPSLVRMQEETKAWVV